MHTKHTALLRAEGNGNAHFVFGHPVIESKSTAFRSPSFNSVSGFAIVTFRVSHDSKRRHILNVVKDIDVNSVEAFVKKYGDILASENARYDSVTGSTGWATFTYSSGKTSTAAAAPVVEKPSKNWHKGIFIRNEDFGIWNTVIALAKQTPVNVLMAGPSGFGKTSVPEAIADKNGLKYLRINCAQVRDPEEWFGYREAIAGSTVFVPSEFSQAVMEGNALIVLDEFNRVEPWLHNTLYPLLDHARKTTVHNETIACGPNVIFVATVNLGYQFTGTFVLDNALMNRMDVVIKVGPLSPDVESDLLVRRYGVEESAARKIVEVMTLLRKQATAGNLTADISTRTSLKVAQLLQPGILNMKQAFGYVLINGLSTEDRKTVIDTISSLLS